MLAYSATSFFRLFDIPFLTFLLNSNFQAWQNSSIWSLRELIWGHFPYSFQRFTCGYLFFKLFYIISRGKEISLSYFYYKYLLVDKIVRLFCLLGISVKFYFYLRMCIYICKNFINDIFFVPSIYSISTLFDLRKLFSAWNSIQECNEHLLRTKLCWALEKSPWVTGKLLSRD